MITEHAQRGKHGKGAPRLGKLNARMKKSPDAATARQKDQIAEGLVYSRCEEFYCLKDEQVIRWEKDGYWRWQFQNWEAISRVEKCLRSGRLS